ncbi:MAG: VWA domain-containing protein [Treponema sp.]|nr:VWA domain-containing protein [Treponema sp.]
MNFNFGNPFIALSALLIIPIAAFIFSRLKNPFVAAIPLGAPGGIPYKTTQIAGIVNFLRFLEITGIFLLFFSAANPAVKTLETVWLNRGADIIFIMDVSPSMAALDMDGHSRFNTGKNLLINFANERPSDSIGLVAVGEEAALLLPPTSDRNTLKMRLHQLRLGEFGDGTALGMGLAVAAYHLDKSNAKRKVAVIITDGENNAGAVHPEDAAALILEMGISFWVIAVGSAGEVPIDYEDPFTKVRHFGTFDSRYDTENLRRLASAGGGTLIIAPSADTFASAFYRIDENEIIIQRSRIINRFSSFSFQFLLTAVILIGTAKFVRRYLLGAVL